MSTRMAAALCAPPALVALDAGEELEDKELHEEDEDEDELLLEDWVMAGAAAQQW